jgi:hypothetical protein
MSSSGQFSSEEVFDIFLLEYKTPANELVRLALHKQTVMSLVWIIPPHTCLFAAFRRAGVIGA